MHDKPFISVNRVAALLGIHHTTAKAMLASFDLPRVLIGTRLVYRSPDVMRRLRELLGHDVAVR